MDVAITGFTLQVLQYFLLLLFLLQGKNVALFLIAVYGSLASHEVRDKSCFCQLNSLKIKYEVNFLNISCPFKATVSVLQVKSLLHTSEIFLICNYINEITGQKFLLQSQNRCVRIDFFKFLCHVQTMCPAQTGLQDTKKKTNIPDSQKGIIKTTSVTTLPFIPSLGNKGAQIISIKRNQQLHFVSSSVHQNISGC